MFETVKTLLIIIILILASTNNCEPCTWNYHPSIGRNLEVFEKKRVFLPRKNCSNMEMIEEDCEEPVGAPHGFCHFFLWFQGGSALSCFWCWSLRWPSREEWWVEGCDFLVMLPHFGHCGLGGGFIFFFNPDPWGEDPIWWTYFFKWVESTIIFQTFLASQKKEYTPRNWQRVYPWTNDGRERQFLQFGFRAYFQGINDMSVLGGVYFESRSLGYY